MKVSRTATEQIEADVTQWAAGSWRVANGDADATWEFLNNLYDAAVHVGKELSPDEYKLHFFFGPHGATITGTTT